MATNRNQKSLLACEHYEWRLFRRDGVYYADGRGNTPNLGKHSLGTRDREEALTKLRRLDLVKAIETGKALPKASVPAGVPTISDGWQLFLDHSSRRTKGKQSRLIPIHRKLRAALETLDRSQGGPVFRAAQGGSLRTRNTLRQFIDHVIVPLKAQFPTPQGEHGFEHGRLHSFRHYFISQALLQSATEGEVREWVGHSSSKLIEHYRTLHAEDARRRMQTLDLLGEDAEPIEPSETPDGESREVA